jgi:type II secretion system protein J
MIAIISSNILQSTLETERTISNRLNDAKNLNFASIIIKRDIRQIINVPLRDYYGNLINGTMIGSNIENKISFNSNIKSDSQNTSPIKRIEYVIEDGTFIRKQYFSANPYNVEDYFESKLINNVSDMNIEFMYKQKWHSQWPINSETQKLIPTLLRLRFKQDSKEYVWIIEPNIDYVL